MKTKILDEIIDNPKQVQSTQELLVLIKDSPIFLEFKENYMNNNDYGIILTFLESKGLYLAINPEFYVNGMNWVWQWFWYRPMDEWKINNSDLYYKKLSSGTYLYGDNNEYPTREVAELSACELAFRLLENGLITGKPILK